MDSVLKDEIFVFAENDGSYGFVLKLASPGCFIPVELQVVGKYLKYQLN
jgi:hypothetical protein